MSRTPRRLRAYALVQGRTHGRSDLPLDALVSSASGLSELGVGAPHTVSPEQSQIIERCASTPQSLADLSAAMDVPLGVVRVLLADLLAHGTLQVHTASERTLPVHQDLALLEEVLDGIESL